MLVALRKKDVKLKIDTATSYLKEMGFLTKQDRRQILKWPQKLKMISKAFTKCLFGDWSAGLKAKPNVCIAAELSQHALSTVTQTKQAAMEIFSGVSGAVHAKRHKPCRGADQSSDFHVPN